jgi:hypothetical protein
MSLRSSCCGLFRTINGISLQTLGINPKTVTKSCQIDKERLVCTVLSDTGWILIDGLFFSVKKKRKKTEAEFVIRQQ